MEAFHAFMNGSIKAVVFVGKVTCWAIFAFVTIIGIIVHSAISK